MDEYPDFPRLVDAMARLTEKPSGFRGTLFRACAPLYANTRDLLTGQGAQRCGGRWNAPNGLLVVYLSMSVEGAIAETIGVASHYGFNPTARLPLTIVAIDVALRHVADMTDAGVRRILGVTLGKMTGCPWRPENASDREALTQAIGRAAMTAGFQGILVPSGVKRSLKNVNIFPLNCGTDCLHIRSSEMLSPPGPAG